MIHGDGSHGYEAIDPVCQRPRVLARKFPPQRRSEQAVQRRQDLRAKTARPDDGAAAGAEVDMPGLRKAAGGLARLRPSAPINILIRLQNPSEPAVAPVYSTRQPPLDDPRLLWERTMATGIKDKVAILGMGCSKFGERWESGPRS